jgi:catechol 2,3-dioxygenase-like lactoylglutathione lyase family enzyme
MLAGNKVVAFVPTNDTARARAFYERVLGLVTVSEDGFALVLDAGGTPVRVTKVGDFAPAPFTVLGWEVADIRRAVAGLVQKGIAFERFGGMDQDPSGIWTAPGGARVAWFKDTDGNVLSITQPASGG